MLVYRLLSPFTMGVYYMHNSYTLASFLVFILAPKQIPIRMTFCLCLAPLLLHFSMACSYHIRCTCAWIKPNVYYARFMCWGLGSFLISPTYNNLCPQQANYDNLIRSFVFALQEWLDSNQILPGSWYKYEQSSFVFGLKPPCCQKFLLLLLLFLFVSLF